MPFDLLLFPLVAGYYLIVTLETRHKYIQLRFDSQKLLFNSVIVGIILSGISFLTTTFFTNSFPNLVTLARSHAPVQKPFFFTACLTLVLSFLICQIGNRILKRPNSIMAAIDVIGNELEILIKDSFEAQTLLLISLKNEKFYIGWATSLPIPTQSKYLSIVPAFSGYRDAEKKLVFTTQYLKVYAQYIEEGKIKGIDDMGVNLVINVDEIISISHFDIDTYERFGGSFETPKIKS